MNFFSSAFFSRNRRAMLDLMPRQSSLILMASPSLPRNGDQFYPYRPQSDFYYFTGLLQTPAMLLLNKISDSEEEIILFIDLPTQKQKLWEGLDYDRSFLFQQSGIEQIEPYNDYKIKLAKSSHTCYVLDADAFAAPNLLKWPHQNLKTYIKKYYPKQQIASPRALINSLRIIKQTCEIEAMRKAISITNLAYRQILKQCHTFTNESDAEAEMTYIFRKNGVQAHAFHPIVAAGSNACTLHYNQNNSALNPNKLLLLDFGAEFNFYAADVSRTIPLSGRFNQRQKELYQMLLEVQKEVQTWFVPGQTINGINEKTKQLLSSRCIDLGLISQASDLYKVYPHGVTHFLGLDVHDVGAKDLPFEKGMVLTCEPGLYINDEQIGIRIENDILVDVVPIDLTSDLVREVSEIEALMNE